MGLWESKFAAEAPERSQGVASVDGLSAECDSLDNQSYREMENCNFFINSMVQLTEDQREKIGA